MPAVIGEAFVSPFDDHIEKDKSGDQKSMSTNTENIRNPEFQNAFQENYYVPQNGITFGVPSGNLGQFYNQVNIGADQLEASYKPYQGYGYVNQAQNFIPQPQQQLHYQVENPAQTFQTYQTLNPSKHDCDRLIVELMSCSHCREKLRKIIRDEEENIHHEQRGGGTGLFSWMNDPKWNTVIANAAIAVVFLFCLDRIIKYRLGS